MYDKLSLFFVKRMIRMNDKVALLDGMTLPFHHGLVIVRGYKTIMRQSKRESQIICPFRIVSRWF
jgi:hypothetical protein